MWIAIRDGRLDNHHVGTLTYHNFINVLNQARLPSSRDPMTVTLARGQSCEYQTYDACRHVETVERCPTTISAMTIRK